MIFIADLLSTNAFFHINNFLILCLILLKISLPYLSETVNSIWIINAFVTYLLENEKKKCIHELLVECSVQYSRVFRVQKVITLCD